MEIASIKQSLSEPFQHCWQSTTTEHVTAHTDYQDENAHTLMPVLSHPPTQGYENHWSNHYLKWVGKRVGDYPQHLTHTGEILSLFSTPK